MQVVRRACVAALTLVALLVVHAAFAPEAGAQITPPTSPTAPETPTPGVDDPAPELDEEGSDATISLDLGDIDGDGKNEPNQSVVIILLLTLLAIAPALLMMVTSFTRIVIVLSLTRNALGLTAIPPNQVVVGLSLFLSLFVMAPTLTEINETALKPLMEGDISYSEAYETAQGPLKEFMLDQTRRGELNLFIKASGEPAPENREDVSLATLIPAFVLSELKTAFIIGFVVFVPFLIIDLVVSSALMSMGMFMLPPVLVSLPFKLLLFVMVDGWALVVRSLITSFN
ncbi:MAG: flagellar type III secretion system pore protein FliP [Actinomycetota bacterium]|nr:flagellar type III secretion system pore protein FliP [Actinomycetota bacterium]